MAGSYTFQVYVERKKAPAKNSFNSIPENYGEFDGFFVSRFALLIKIIRGPRHGDEKVRLS